MRSKRLTAYGSRFTVFSLLMGLLSTCKLVNPASPVPAYIRIDKFTVTTDKANQGSSSNAIVDAWVYVDGQIAGVFQMPVSVPLLYSGTHTIMVKPGVIVNGIAATQIDYPFYTPYTQEVNLSPGKVDTLHAVTTYNNATFSLIEDFDQAHVTFTRSPDYTDSIHIITNPSIILEGKCGAALLSANDPSFDFISIDSFPMPVGAPQYMELDYRSTNIPFAVGLQSFIEGFPASSGDDIVILTPSATWQKIYVNLNIVSQLYPTATYFKVYMRGGISGQTSGAVYFDNIKVIHSG